MKKIELEQAIAIIANIGVIASLIFVGLQVQQEATASRSATVLQLKDSWVQLNLVAATSVELADAMEVMDTQGWNAASFQERTFVTGFFRTLFHNWSNAYYHYQNGTLDEIQWGAYLREAATALESPIIRQVWSEWNFVYDDSFRVLIDDLLTKVDMEAD